MAAVGQATSGRGHVSRHHGHQEGPWHQRRRGRAERPRQRGVRDQAHADRRATRCGVRRDRERPEGVARGRGSPPDHRGAPAHPLRPELGLAERICPVPDQADLRAPEQGDRAVRPASDDRRAVRVVRRVPDRLPEVHHQRGAPRSVVPADRNGPEGGDRGVGAAAGRSAPGSTGVPRDGPDGTDEYLRFSGRRGPQVRLPDDAAQPVQRDVREGERAVRQDPRTGLREVHRGSQQVAAPNGVNRTSSRRGTWATQGR